MPRRRPLTVARARRAIDNLTPADRTVRADERLLEELARACYGPDWRRAVAHALRSQPTSATLD